MRKWHLYKEYITFDNGNKTALKYMALFCTNNDGSYRKHIDIVYNKTSYDIITDIVDGSYFTFIYDLGKPEVQDMVNETDLVKKIQKMFDGSIPETAIRKHRKREFYPYEIKGEILISKFGNASTSIVLDANKSLFDCDNIDKNGLYDYGQNGLMFDVQENIELKYLKRLACFNDYNELKKYLKKDSLVPAFEVLTVLLLILIHYEQIKLSYDNKDNIIDITTHFDNIRNNFFEVGSQLSTSQLELCLHKYFGIHTKDVISQILKYKKAKDKENIVGALFAKISKFFNECKVDISQLIGAMTAGKELAPSH